MVAVRVGNDGRVVATAQTHQYTVSHNCYKNESGICSMYMFIFCQMIDRIP